MSDPETISWRDALKRIIETGHAEDDATSMLVEAVVSNTIPYYPRRALPLGKALHAGLFNPQTSAWRMHARDDNPFLVRLVRSEFDRWLGKLRRPSKAGGDKSAINFLSIKLTADRDLRRDDAWKACKSKFPNLSERRFIAQVWPQAREDAGLERAALAGRKPTAKN